MTIFEDIRKDFQVSNFYDLLGIPKNSSQKDIKKAYLHMSLLYHPDKTCDESKKRELERKFQILSHVYRILSDSTTRSDYDLNCRQVSLLGDEQLICDEVTLRDCLKDSDSYYHFCRCSGKFILPMDLVEPSIRQSFIVDCDSCSNSIKIVI